MTLPTFEEFRAEALARGADEVLVRQWGPSVESAPHEHPFDTRALVVHGELWLSVNGRTQHLRAGDTFELGRGVLHTERYGPEGATFWAARVNPRAP